MAKEVIKEIARKHEKRLIQDEKLLDIAVLAFRNKKFESYDDQIYASVFNEQLHKC